MSTQDLDQIFRQTPHATLVRRGGAAFLLNTQQNRAYAVNEVAVRIWQMLASPKALRDVVEGVKAEFAAPAGGIEGDVGGYVAALTERDLLAHQELLAPVDSSTSAPPTRRSVLVNSLLKTTSRFQFSEGGRTAMTADNTTSPVNTSSRLSTRNDVVAEVSGDELVLVQLSDGTYYALNEVGRRVWELVAEEKTVGEIVATLSTEYDADTTSIGAHVTALTKQLLSNRLIRVAV